MSLYDNKDALMNREFLKQLDSYKHREVFAQIISLDFQENPIEKIEGRVTGGSINIDGASAVRRTCSLSLVAKEVNINDFYWGLNTKFKLEIGLKNMIDNNYPEIIWFPQGVYVITSFNTNQSTNNYNISISGKDKMCLLNGEVGGNLSGTIDFGTEVFEDLKNNRTIYTKIPIKQIIREMLHTYALEPYYNIIIDDLEAAGLELMEYRGEDYYYFIYNAKTQQYINLTFDGNMPCKIKNASGQLQDTTIGEIEHYFHRVEELINNNNTINNQPIVTRVYFDSSEDECYVARIEYGDAAGYKITDLVYAGELVSSIGETITSILDKIKNMLGEYEYFYDLDGRFIFQKKRNYINSSFNTIISNEDGRYAENSAYYDSYVYTFEGGNLITAYQNTPNLTNLKNDFSIWGNRKGIQGGEIPIHLRYAIDKKPSYYKSVNVTKSEINTFKALHPFASEIDPQDSKIYSTEYINGQEEIHDWREIIYQMAKDFYAYGLMDEFATKIIEANGELYPNGKTGYEQYYVDIISFWRELYNPQADFSFSSYEDKSVYDGLPTFELNNKNHPYGLFLKEGFVRYDASQEEGKTQPEIRQMREKVYKLMDCLDSEDENRANRKQMQPLLDSIVWGLKLKDNGKEQDYTQVEGTEYKWKYVIPCDGGFTPIEPDFIHRITKSEIFIGYFNANNGLIDNEDKYKPISLLNYQTPDETWYVKSDFSEMDNNEKGYCNLNTYLNIQEDPQLYSNLYNLYIDDNGKYYNFYYQEVLDIYGALDTKKTPKRFYFKYYDKAYDYLTQQDLEVGQLKNGFLHWSKNIIDSPELLNFWIDFLDLEGELGQFAVSSVGIRSKIVNDKDVKSIYFKKVPEVIYVPTDDTSTNEIDEQYRAYDLIEKANYWNYKLIKNIPEHCFSLSSQGKSAYDVLDGFLYNHSYCIETINLTAIPIYYLSPNTRILVKDELSKINGEYLVSRISIPLTYNGTMNITATKAPTRLY